MEARRRIDWDASDDVPARNSIPAIYDGYVMVLQAKRSCAHAIPQIKLALSTPKSILIHSLEQHQKQIRSPMMSRDDSFSICTGLT